ncbi:MAG: hypothetical protein ACFFH0_11660 [Promethearchaeota archaeon]
MALAGMILGILSIIGMGVGLTPLLGWMNWGVIPTAIVGLLVSVIGLVISQGQRRLAVAGIVLCIVAIVIGTIKLVVGFGIL